MRWQLNLLAMIVTRWTLPHEHFIFQFGILRQGEERNMTRDEWGKKWESGPRNDLIFNLWMLFLAKYFVKDSDF